jgi:transcriptional regulator with XRE-family HTH domain
MLVLDLASGRPYLPTMLTPAQRLRKIRERKNLTQEELAALVRAAGCPCNASWISNFERRKDDSPPSGRKLRGLVRALNVEPILLLGDGAMSPRRKVVAL